MTSAKVQSSRKWLVMASVASGVFLATIDGSIVNVALPTLERDLHTQFSAVQWVVLGYLLAIATLMLGIGRLADMIGKKRLYLTGFLIFTLGSAACGLSNSIGMLISFRIFQAIGGALMMALGTAIVTEAFPPRQRGMVMGVTGLMVSIGAVSGPTIGGLLLGTLSWHWIFFVNLPIGVIGSLMVWRFVPSHRPEGGEKFDFAGAGAMFIALLSLLLGLTLGQNQGFTSLPVLVLFAAFVLSLIAFIRIERRSKQPMVDLSLFSSNLFSVNLITGFLTFVCSAGSVLLMPFFLQNIMQFSPEKAGLLLAVVPLSMGLIAPLSGTLSDRFGTRPLTVLGLAMLLGGYLAVSTLTTSVSTLGYIVRFIPIGLGMGIFQSPNNSAIMGAAPRNRLGVASGLLSLTRTVGQTSGIAILGAIWASLVMQLTHSAPGADATAAPVAVQMSALHTTLLVIVGLVGFALLLSIWALWKERKLAAAEAHWKGSSELG
jgi:EmrB/QacA subfamily drug resistance transporter